jgi:hypothetical protein
MELLQEHTWPTGRERSFQHEIRTRGIRSSPTFSLEEYLKAFGLDLHAPVKSKDEAYELIKAEMIKYSARELEQKNMELGACGQTCFSPAAWRETLMGKLLDRHPLINYTRVPFGDNIPPVPFPKVESDPRPLAGIKVVELARVIAGPARELP